MQRRGLRLQRRLLCLKLGCARGQPLGLALERLGRDLVVGKLLLGRGLLGLEAGQPGVQQLEAGGIAGAGDQPFQALDLSADADQCLGLALGAPGQRPGLGLEAVLLVRELVRLRPEPVGLGLQRCLLGLQRRLLGLERRGLLVQRGLLLLQHGLLPLGRRLAGLQLVRHLVALLLLGLELVLKVGRLLLLGGDGGVGLCLAGRGRSRPASAR